jgi:Effector Associated Constant Component 1
MDAEIRISGGDEVAEFAALWAWLRGERALTGTVSAVQRAPAESELGGVFDVLAVSLGSGGAGVALARSLVTWLQTRRSDVRITVTSSAGKVEFEAHRVKDSDALLLLQEMLSGQDEP